MNGPVLLVGNPNAGKTTIFNALTGLNSRIANYPGVTVEARQGLITRQNQESITVVDLPGVYSLIPNSEDEELTIKSLIGLIEPLKKHSLVVVIIDVNELRRGLYLYSQVIELGFRAIIALTMVDERPEFSNKKLIKSLSKIVGAYVVPVNAKDKKSLDLLTSTIDGMIAGSLKNKLVEQPLYYEGLSDGLIRVLGTPKKSGLFFIADKTQSEAIRRNRHIYLYGLQKRGRAELPSDVLRHLNLSKSDVLELDALISRMPEERFKRVDSFIKALTTMAEANSRSTSDAIDNALLHPLFGSIFAIALLTIMLNILFIIASPIADFMSKWISLIGIFSFKWLPESSLLHSLLIDGVVEGLGSILSFLPLIAILFFFMSILEDSGYLARTTFLFDKLLKKFGLCGRSLVPMLGGFACAVPAILATRNIGNKKSRLITLMVTPFLTCSARLPVFGLITGALFSAYPPIFGLINLGALMFVSMYMLGIGAALLSAFVLSKILKNSEIPKLTIELPPYRMPDLNIIFKRVLERISIFMKDVGSVILAATVLMWALFRIEIHPPKIKPATEVMSVQKPALENSVAGVIGKAIEPVFAPLGFDWQVSMGILASFLAREVFVSTMAVIYGIADEEDGSNLKNSFRNHITPLSGLCLLIFFTLSMQCISTLAATKRETGSLVWPILQFSFMSGSAYMLSLIVHVVGSTLGFS